MSNYELTQDVYLTTTPKGAYQAATSRAMDKSQKFLLSILNERKTPLLTQEKLSALTGMADEKSCELLMRCQNVGWVQAVSEEMTYPEGSLDEVLPVLLSGLSESGKVLLADSQGFYLASSGFPHEVAEELAALSAEISQVHQRRSGVLMKNLGVGSEAWSIVDPVGNSKIGFWPILIGKTKFVVTVSGSPHFNHPDFVNLIWALSIRYSTFKK